MHNRSNGLGLIALASMIFMIVLTTWSLSSPVASSPDEGDILASVWCANGQRDRICEIDKQGTWHVPNGVYNWCFQHKPNISASCSNSQNLESLTPAEEQIRISEFARFLNLFAGSPVSHHVMAIRIINNLFSAGLLFIGLIFATPLMRKILIFASALFLLPNSLYLLSTAHPSGASALVAILATSSAVQADVTSRRAALRDSNLRLIAGLLIYMFFIRRDSFILIGLAISLLLFTRIYRNRNLSVGSIVRFIFAAIALIWIVKIAVTQLKVSVASMPVTINIWGSSTHPDRASWNILTTNIQNFPSLIIGQFGYWGLGALDVVMPIVVWGIVLVAVVSVLTFAIIYAEREFRFYFSSIIVVYVILTLAILQTSKLYVGEEMQPRYLFPLLVVGTIGLIATTSFPKEIIGNIRGSIFVLLSLIGFAHSIALWTLLRRYTSGLDAGELDLNIAREWWWGGLPFSPNFVWLIGTTAFVAFLLIPFIAEAPVKAAEGIRNKSARIQKFF